MSNKIKLDLDNKSLTIEPSSSYKLIEFFQEFALVRNYDLSDINEVKKLLIPMGYEIDSSMRANLFIDNGLEDSFGLQSVRAMELCLDAIGFKLEDVKGVHFPDVLITGLTDEELFELKLKGF